MQATILLEEDKMEDRRQFKRYPIQLSAKYLKESGDEWKYCSIIDISSKGIRINVSSHEELHLNATLQLEIIVSTKEKSIKATGTLVWLKEITEKMTFEGATSLTKMIVCGVKLVKIDNEDKQTLLEYAYGNWPGSEEE